jgi:hypothetical protein
VNDPVLVLRNDSGEVWRGDALDPSSVSKILGDRKADALIFDAPYSSRTHAGHHNGIPGIQRAASFGASSNSPEASYSAHKAASGESGRRDIDYPAWTSTDVENFCDLWVPRCNGWVVSITDDVLSRDWRSSLDCNGLYPFTPLPLVETGSRVRMTGDGPSCWTCWVVVARPRGGVYAKWGTLPGAYIQPGERNINSAGGSDRIVGGKPLASMISIVDDYSRSGDLVVDPVCGGWTTLLAAVRTGRRYLGIEKDEGRAKLSAERMAAEANNTTTKAVRVGQSALFPVGFGK